MINLISRFRFSDCVNDLLSLINVMQFGFSGITTCAVTFQLSVLDLSNSTVGQQIVALIAMVGYLMCVTVQIFVPCLSASEVTENSERLPYFLFECNWIEQRPQFKSSMLIFVERAMQPIIPMAGGLFQIGLPRFVAVSIYTEVNRLQDRSYLLYCITFEFR